jgi:DNA ligase D-like protein (predicted ligase)
MAAQLVPELPEGEAWLYEVKWDGYRALILKTGDQVKIRSRNDNDFTLKFPSIARAATDLKADTLAPDGEIVALDPDGRPSFQALRHSSHAGHQIVFYAFDVLHLNGTDLSGRHLAERRRALQRVVSSGSVIRISDALPGTASDIMRALRDAGIEGVIAKRKDSLYQPGERSGDWVKVKLEQQQELVIGGYRPNVDSVDAILVGFYQGKQLMFAGKVRAGFVPHVRREIGALLKPLHSTNSPFSNLPDARLSHWGAGITAEQMKEMQWVTPRLVAQISFVEWTGDNRLRHARFLGLRLDKTAKEVRRES